MFIESPQSDDPSVQPADGESVEIAQASPSGAESIGSITALQGAATITRADGTKVQAADGAPIFQGDQIETGANGAVGITFADESTFSLANDGQMIIDEMVYDPGTQSGKSVVSVAEGVFTFVSGQIAKTGVDAMTITTPVATIGVRGTAGGGQAGPEGTPNTFSMFAQQGGVVGEMTITTLGGSQTLSSPNQTTQISSAFVPPSQPVTLPPAAVARFYAKAAAVAPTAIITQPTSTGQTGDSGPTGQAGGPAAGATPEQAAEQAAEEAAAEAFEKVLAEGGSLEDAMAAAVDGATEAGLEAVLAINPEHFGSEGAGNSVLSRQIDNVMLGVTGQIDHMGAGTGSGTGNDNFSNRMFFQDEIDHFIQDDIGDLLGGLFDDFFDHDGEDGLDVTELGFEDPFDIFNKEAFEENFDFGFEDFLFEVFSPLTLDDGILGFDESDFFFDDDEGDAFITTGEFSDFITNFSSGSETRFGGEGNSRFTMFGDAFGSPITLGGDDTVFGGGGADELAFENIQNIAFIVDAAANSGRGVVSYSNVGGTLSGQVTLNSIEQIFVDDGDLARVRFPLELAHGSGFGYIIVGGTADDTLTVVDTTNLLTTYGGLSNFTYTGGGSDGTTVKVDNTGPDFFDAPNRIFGSVIMGAGGNDTIIGSNASDILFGGEGDDIITTGSGGDDGDIVFGSDGNDTVILNVSGMLFGSFNGGAADGVDTGANDVLQVGNFGGSSNPTYNLQNTVIQKFEILNIQEDGLTINAPLTFYSNFSSIVVANEVQGVVLQGSGGLELSGVTLILGTNSTITTLTIDTAFSTGGNLVDFTDAGGRTLNGTSGQDIITGFRGADVINLGASDGASDIVRYTALNEGAANLTIANADDINQFGANDLIQFINSGINLAGLGSIAVNSGTVNMASGNGVLYINNATATSLSTIGDVAGAIGSLTNSSVGDKAIFVVRADSGPSTGVYAFTDGNGDTTVDAVELSLLAVVDANLTELNVSIL